MFNIDSQPLIFFKYLLTIGIKKVCTGCTEEFYFAQLQILLVRHYCTVVVLCPGVHVLGDVLLLCSG